MKMNPVILLLFFSLLTACQPKGEVEVLTSGITKPITFGITSPFGNGQLIDLADASIDFDEWDITRGPLPVVITITNHSSFPYTDITIKTQAIDDDGDDSNSNLRYALQSGEEVGFPGAGGTCQRILAPGNSCKVKMEIVFSAEGNYQEKLKLSFKNLVDPEEYSGSIKVLSGTPAKLEVTSGVDLVKFNEVNNPLITKPLVERTGNKTYRQKVTFKNVGGLKARELKIIKPAEECKNLSGGVCSPEFQDVYSYEASCEGVQTLLPGETCTVDISYRPKNSEDIDLGYDEEIIYRGGVQFVYFKNPEKALSSLPINFESISSKIEGRLRAEGVKNLPKVIQGNRHSEEIMVNNIGYRELRIKKLVFKYSPVATWAECQASRDSTSKMLVCQSGDADFPFRVTDTDNCLKRTERTVEINDGTHRVTREGDVTIGGNCKFILTFAPSTSAFFVNDSSSFIKSNYSEGQITLSYEYDSQWKGGEDQCLGLSCSPNEEKYMKRKERTSIKATRSSAARLEISDVKFDSDAIRFINQTPTPNLFGSLSTYDLGDQILMGSKYRNTPENFKRIDIQIKNTGDTSAKLVKIYTPKSKDGISLEEIPFDKSVKPFLSDFYNCNSTDNNCFFRNAQTTQDCSIIESGDTCIIQLQYSPFVRNPIPEPEDVPCRYQGVNPPPVNYYDCSMFDPDSFVTESTPPFKSFIFRFENGVKNTNQNGSDSVNPPTPWVESKVMLRAKLFAAGRLMEMIDDIRNEKDFNNLVRGSKRSYKIYVENIGAGKVTALNIKSTPQTPLANWYLSKDQPTPTECLSMPEPDCRCYEANSCSDSLSLPSEGFCTYQFIAQSVPESKVDNSIPLLLNNLINNSIGHKFHSRETGLSALMIGGEYKDCFEVPGAPTGVTRRLRRTHYIHFNRPLTQSMVIPRLTDNSTNPPWHTSYLERLQFNYNPLTQTYSYGDNSRLFFQGHNAWSTDLTASPNFERFNETIRAFLNSLLPAKNRLPTSPPFFLAPTDDPTGEYQDKNYYHFFLGQFPAYSIRQQLNGTNSITGELALENVGQVDTRLTFNLKPSSNNPIRIRGGLPEIDLTTGSSLTLRSLVPNNVLPLKFEMTPLSTCAPTQPGGECYFEREISFTYSTGIKDIGFPQDCTPSLVMRNSTTFRDSQEEQCERTVTILVSGIVDLSNSQQTSPFSVAQKKIEVALRNGRWVDDNCTTFPFSPTSPSFNSGSFTNQGQVAPEVKMIGVRVANAQGVYTKSYFTFTNVSNDALMITQLRIRKSQAIVAESLGTAFTGLSLNSSAVLPDSLASSDCKTLIDQRNFCTGFPLRLDPGQTCTAALRFQPFSSTQLLSGAQLSMAYHSATKTPAHRNILNVPLNFEFRSQSRLFPVFSGTGTNNIRNNVTNLDAHVVRPPSSPFFFGTSGNNVYQFTVNLTTQGTDSASLLKQWYKSGKTSLPSTSDYDSGGFTLDPIARGLRPGFMEVRAHRGCLTNFIGANFCSLRIRVTINEMNLYRNSSFATTPNPPLEEMENNALFLTQLEYYNLNDNSTSATMNLFLNFDVRPLLSAYNPNFRATSSLPTGTNFAVDTPPSFTITEDSRGPVVGYRLLRFRSKDRANNLNSLIFKVSTSTEVIKDCYTTNWLNCLSMAPPTNTSNEFFYYKILAIRNSSQYKLGRAAFGLAQDSHYLNEISAPTLGILTPGIGVTYLISDNVLIDNARSSRFLDYQTSVNWCSNQTTGIISNNGTRVNRNKALLIESVFPKLILEFRREPYWISSQSTAFSSVCPGITANMVEHLNCLRILPTAPSGRLVLGDLRTILNSPMTYTGGYFDPLIREGIYTRCYTPLPTP